MVRQSVRRESGNPPPPPTTAESLWLDTIPRAIIPVLAGLMAGLTFHHYWTIPPSTWARLRTEAALDGREDLLEEAKEKLHAWSLRPEKNNDASQLERGLEPPLHVLSLFRELEGYAGDICERLRSHVPLEMVNDTIVAAGGKTKVIDNLQWLHIKVRQLTPMAGYVTLEGEKVAFEDEEDGSRVLASSFVCQNILPRAFGVRDDSTTPLPLTLKQNRALVDLLLSIAERELALTRSFRAKTMQAMDESDSMVQIGVFSSLAVSLLLLGRGMPIASFCLSFLLNQIDSILSPSYQSRVDIIRTISDDSLPDPLHTSQPS